MAKYRIEGNLKFGPPLYVAIACDLVGALLLAAGVFLAADQGQKILAIVVGAALLVISSCLMLWQVLKHGKRVPNHRWR